VAVEAPVALREDLSGLFRGYAVHDANGRTADVTIRVEGDATGYTVLGPGATKRCRDAVELFAAVEFALTKRFIAGVPNWIRLHAAGTHVGGRAVLALGPAGAGKSSLATAWQRAGNAAYGDDVVLLDRDGLVHPFRRLFKVAPAVLDGLGIAPEETPYWESGSSEAWYDPAEGAGWGSPACVGVVAVIRFRPRAGYRATPLRRGELLAALLASRIPPVSDPVLDVATCARVAGSARGLKLEFGDVREAATRLAEAAG
jgi:hypothetical protein